MRIPDRSGIAPGPREDEGSPGEAGEMVIRCKPGGTNLDPANDLRMLW
jgi:hypothetical protein